MRAKYQGHLILSGAGKSLSFDEWVPSDPTDFSVTFDFHACPEGENTADAFTATVCSPSRFLREHGGRTVFSGENIIFMSTFDAVELVKYLIQHCAETEGDTWANIAVQLTTLGRWEFDYRLMLPRR